MYYYNKYEKSFTPYPPVPEKIIVDGVEVDNPEFLSLEKYTLAEILTIIENANASGKIIQSSGNTFVLVDKPEPTVEETTKQRIAELKTYLDKTDYQTIKFAEGELSAEDYADMKVQRAEWRAEINQLEEKINNLRENNNE